LDWRARNDSMDFSADQPVSSAISESDRRRHTRFTAKVQIELRLEGDDTPIRAETSDLSRGGCYLQLSFTLTEGTHVQGRLWLDGAPVKFRGRVVTAHPQFGNGIMFTEFEDNGEQLLGSYLEAIVD
jgi:PilZ domain